MPSMKIELKKSKNLAKIFQSIPIVNRNKYIKPLPTKRGRNGSNNVFERRKDTGTEPK